MHLNPPVPVRYVNFGMGGGAKYQLQCKNHPKATYATKNPWSRSIFITGEQHMECNCSMDDMLVTFIPDDLTAQPVGGVHFKATLPGVYRQGREDQVAPSRLDPEYWVASYPTAVTVLGNLTRSPSPATCFAAVARSYSHLDDAATIEKTFTDFI